MSLASSPPSRPASSVFAGFRQVLRKGTLIFALIVAALSAMIGYQYQRSATSVRAVDHTRQVIAYIDALRTYLLNLDNAARKYAESPDPAHLDLSLVCHAAPCPSSERLLELVGPDADQTVRLAPLPALEAALETGFAALHERATNEVAAAAPERDLAGFDKSAMEQIHRILIEAGRAELARLEEGEKARVRDQNLMAALLGVTVLWTGLALIGLYRETMRLITAGVDAEQTIRALSLRDPLTGLPNRRYLQENEKHLLAIARRAQKQTAVLAVDLDDFKAVNDRQGHAAGDAVLVASAQRMSQLLRETDVVARMGGDEFVIVLGQVESAAAAREVGNRVVASLCQPVPLADGGHAQIGASVGFALSRDATLDNLLKRADAALYEAKRAGKNTCRGAGPSDDTLHRMRAG
ncbi:MAG: diguanylate cyclase domain-containing protein [Gammaproteobacteria bacterium]